MGCTTCKKNDHCCIFNRDGFCFVGLKNAEKIKKKINKDYSYFLDYSPLSKKLINELKTDDPVLEGALRYKQLDEGKILRLKTQKNGRCIFLQKNGKCAIYDIRPNICKIFPYWVMKLTNGKMKVIAHDPFFKCNIFKDILPKQEITNLKKVFKEIQREDKEYRPKIKAFVKKLEK
ncbi:MAG: YkgJ family cysteine cluster protein [Candidatus Woesearchaeota archaeon]|jgi:Fe-S-cluster containining protein